MLFSALFILFAVEAVIGDDEECHTKAKSMCKSLDFKDVPATMQDLERDCGLTQDYIKCMQEVNAKCPMRYFSSERMGKVAQFMKTNCDEGSSLYRALSRNYECIQPIARNVSSECRPFEIMEHEEFNDKVSKVEGMTEKAKSCDYTLFQSMCMGHVFYMRCGQEAKEVVTEIFQNMNMGFGDCIEENLQPLKDVFEPIISEAFKA